MALTGGDTVELARLGPDEFAKDASRAPTVV
jgi:hypothetical protein